MSERDTPAFRLSAHYGELHKRGDRYDIVFTRLLNYPVEKVWEAITQPEQLNKWFCPNLESSATAIDLRLGGKVKIQLMMAVMVGTITALEKERLLQYDFDMHSALRWELYKEDNGRCKLVFTELGLEQGYLGEVAAGWHGYLDFLGLVLDEQKVPSFLPGNWNNIAGDTITQYTVLLNTLNNSK